MADAVAGPPIFAFDVIIAFFKEKSKSFAAAKENSILTQTIIKQNTKSREAVLIITGIDAGTPRTTKKI